MWHWPGSEESSSPRRRVRPTSFRTSTSVGAPLALSAGILSAVAHGADGPSLIAVMPGETSGATTIAIAVWDHPCSQAEAAMFASRIGAVLAAPSSPEDRHRWRCLRRLPSLGIGPCDGPWIDATREAASAGKPSDWRRSDGTPVESPHWAPARPMAGPSIPAAAALDQEARWIDLTPTPDAGATARTAAVVWPNAEDADANGLPDALDAALDRLDLEALDADLDGDGMVDGCATFGDLDGSGAVDAGDLSLMLSAWGETDHVADLDGSGIVESADLALLLSRWG